VRTAARYFVGLVVPVAVAVGVVGWQLLHATGPAADQARALAANWRGFLVLGLLLLLPRTVAFLRSRRTPRPPRPTRQPR
jgi:hypothetical protein